MAQVAYTIVLAVTWFEVAILCISNATVRRTLVLFRAGANSNAVHDASERYSARFSVVDDEEDREPPERAAKRTKRTRKTFERSAEEKKAWTELANRYTNVLLVHLARKNNISIKSIYKTKLVEVLFNYL